MASAALAAACGPTATSGRPAPAELIPSAESAPNPLDVYQRLGFVVGDRRFPVVGNFVYLPGPADTTYAIFAFSLPNSALKFRRDPPGFVARYRVDITAGDSAAPAARLSETEEVRVRTFRETSRRDESVIFQGFLKLRPGSYALSVSVRDLAGAAGFAARKQLSVPPFQHPFITPPIVVYRAEPRANREAPPSLILNPRATLPLAGSAPPVYIETSAAGDTAPVLEVYVEGEVISTDTLTLRPGPGPLRSAVHSIPAERLPPGKLTLRVRHGALEPIASTTLLIALTPDWVVADYQEAISFLRYAGLPQQLDSLLAAPPRERAHQLQAFWKRKDSVPDTPENEFFKQYFRRIRDANDRFAEADNAGWLTDRGAVYVTFGPPDEVLHHLDPGQGPEQRQVWLYNKSLGFELRLVFTDPTASGAFRLTIKSRRAFLQAVQTLYS